MKGVTHFVSGVVLGVSLGYTKPVELGVLCIATLIPDIDRAQSLLGRYLPIAPTIIKWVFGKRTLTHSLLLGGIAAWFLFVGHRTWFSPFLIGFSLHVFLDLLTGYVGLLFPLPKKFTLTFGVSPVIIEGVYIIGLVLMVASQYRYFLAKLGIGFH
jgi:inner membrane protein